MRYFRSSLRLYAIRIRISCSKRWQRRFPITWTISMAILLDHHHGPISIPCPFALGVPVIVLLSRVLGVPFSGLNNPLAALRARGNLILVDALLTIRQLSSSQLFSLFPFAQRPYSSDNITFRIPPKESLGWLLSTRDCPNGGPGALIIYASYIYKKGSNYLV